ncbi:hypothetical protein H4R27_006306, partial [Coemansia aciculifera]
MLEYDPDRIAARWRDHFAGLAVDESGNSMDLTHWQDMFSGTAEDLDVNGPLRWDEIVNTLATMPFGRAAGIDCIPVELVDCLEVDIDPNIG